MRRAGCIAVLAALLTAGRAHAVECPPPDHLTRATVPGQPFAALADASGCWLFVSVSVGATSGSVVLLHGTQGVFEIGRAFPLKSSGAYGEALSHDGRVLVVSGGPAVSVLDVERLQTGEGNPLLGVLAGFTLAIYAAISPDDRLLVISDERSPQLSIYDLAKARTRARDALIGRIPAGRSTLGLVGLAFSPDGHWLYATSQVGPPRGRPSCRQEGTKARPMVPAGLLLRVDAVRAATSPAHALADAVPAGCFPVRVAVSPSGRQVWVTARGDNTLLRFAVDGWLANRGAPGVATYAAGPSPVGVAVRPDGDEVWVAVSSRFDKQGTGQLARLRHIGGTAPITIQTMPSAGFPREVSFLPDGRTAVATLFDAGQVEIVPVSASE